MPRMTVLSARAVLAALGVLLCHGAARADDPWCIGGVSFRVTPGKDTPGHDFLATQARTPQLCAVLCANDARCTHFTFLDGVAPGSRPSCYLKTAATTSTPMDAATSAARTGRCGPAVPPFGVVREVEEDGVERQGGDYRKFLITPEYAAAFPFAPPDATPLVRALVACGQTCNADSHCLAMSLIQRPADPDPVCYLKKTVGQWTALPGAVSAVKLGSP